jgi:hypothetical protein
MNDPEDIDAVGSDAIEHHIRADGEAACLWPQLRTRCAAVGKVL